MKKLISVLMIFAMLLTAVSIAGAADGQEYGWSLKPSADITGIGSYDYREGVGIVVSQQIGPNNYIYGIIDANGNTVIPYEYGKLTPLNDKYVIAVAKEYNKEAERYDCAIIDLNNKQVIEYGKYDMLDRLNDELIIASKDDKCGVIDINENIVIPFEYQSMSRLTDNLVRVYNNGLGVIDITQKVIIPTQYRGEIWSTGNFIYCHDNSYAENTPFVADINGKMLIESEDIRRVHYCEKDVVLVEFADGSYTNINSKGETLDFKGNKISHIGDDFYIRDFTSSGRANILDVNFNPLMEDKYYSITHLGGEIFRASELEGNKSYLINRNGTLIESLKDYSANKLVDNLITINGTSPIYGYVTTGVADLEGNIIIPPLFKYILDAGNNKLLIQTVSGRWGFAQLGSGEPVKNWVDGIALTIGSTNASIYGEPAVCDVAPIIRDSRTMLPARFVAENLGGTVSWDEAAQTVTITTDEVKLVLTIGSTEATYENTKDRVNMKVFMDVPAFIENGRTYTPVRFVAQYLGAEVFWDDTTQTAIIIN